MPCYDDRDRDDGSSYDAGRVDGIREATHNSVVAELLCSLCKQLEARNLMGVLAAQPIQDWWHEHKARDARVAARRKQQKKERRIERLVSAYRKRLEEKE